MAESRTLDPGAQPAAPDGPPPALAINGPAPAQAARMVLVGMTRDELAAFLAPLGEPRYRASQVYDWIYRKGVKSFDAMTNLPQALRQRLDQVATLVTLTEAARQHAAATRTTKFLFRLAADGSLVESVLMGHDYGWSACVTTQVGCRMGCAFCASTLGGLVRNLTAGEIVDQVIVMNGAVPAGERIGHVVLMGSGEPLENYDATVKALRLLHDPEGLNIGWRHITVSTSGLAPAMRRLAEEGVPVRLALSLHAPDDELRSRLMPVNRIWPIAEVLDAARYYAHRTGRRITIEYILIEDVNDRPDQAEALARLLDGLHCHINLIPLNPVPERPQFRRPAPERVQRFQAVLQAAGYTVTVRREMGGDIDAACGQLRHKAERAARQRHGPLAGRRR